LDRLAAKYSTQLTTPKEKKSGLTRGKKLKTYINYIPDSLVNSQDVFAIVSQLINDIGKLFHTSIILAVKKFHNIQIPNAPVVCRF